ncbi:DUF2599 domain-containing protein [Streptomyces sp. uw30]|uniref:DUF2599 domain-containing protein n=1 Tax=Streptomyces sp. uw30 TaxID=1828179 RepID=UPI001C9CE15A|nr:DUF2599 domain-containing protein [Streptomyces sp. uw30]
MLIASTQHQRAFTAHLLKGTQAFMKRAKLPRLAARKSAAGLLALAAAAFGVMGLAPSAEAAPAAYCGPSKYVEKIEVASWGDNQFQIVLTPTQEARLNAAFSPTPRDAVVEQWHAIQACVPGLYGGLADTIWDQLECHQLNSWIAVPQEGSKWITGDTYDLESWRPVLPRLVPGEALIVTRCLNSLGVDPAGPFSSPIRPDAGQVDLQQAMRNFA